MEPAGELESNDTLQDGLRQTRSQQNTHTNIFQMINYYINKVIIFTMVSIQVTVLLANLLWGNVCFRRLD